jgi:SSS family transporter
MRGFGGVLTHPYEVGAALASPVLAQPASRFSWPDWLIIAAYLLLTTAIGAKLAGKQANIRDFFLGGRKLPWLAITGSIIATEVSAVTLVAVPTISFAEGGNLTYLQWAVGAIGARVLIGLYFVPKYYEREIYSPYEYLARCLGAEVKRVTTGLFLVGAVLGQGARLYVTAFVLSAVTGLDLVSCIWVIGAFSIAWTLLGGMTTVIWTDVIQFIVFTVGAAVALYWAIAAIPGSFRETLEMAQSAGKLDWFDGTLDLSKPYTIWVGVLAMPFLNLAAFGTDQVMAQRMFCCRNQREASKAIIASSVSIVIAVLVLAVGVALYCYFRAHPFTTEEARRYADRNTYLLPIFIVRAMPVGVRSLVVAAVFAAAISTLDGALTALAQTTHDACGRFLRANQANRAGRLPQGLLGEVAFSRVLVVFWGCGLCLMAMACIPIAAQYANAVELAFALVGYTYGPMLGIFLLAFLSKGRDHSGVIWAVPMSVLAILGMYQHAAWADWVVWGAVAAMVLCAIAAFRRSPFRLAVVICAAALTLLLHHVQVGTTAAGEPKYLAFNWSYPIGTIMTYVLGHCLAQRRVLERTG